MYILRSSLSPGKPYFWLATPRIASGSREAFGIYKDGGIDDGHWSHDVYRSQRPLVNLSIRNQKFDYVVCDTEVTKQ